jgi:hypothetical protein
LRTALGNGSAAFADGGRGGKTATTSMVGAARRRLSSWLRPINAVKCVSAARRPLEKPRCVSRPRRGRRGPPQRGFRAG